MIRQGDRAQTNYRRSETLPGVIEVSILAFVSRKNYESPFANIMVFVGDRCVWY